MRHHRNRTSPILPRSYHRNGGRIRLFGRKDEAGTEEAVRRLSFQYPADRHLQPVQHTECLRLATYRRLLVCIGNTDLPHPAAEPFAGEPERTDRTILRPQPVRRLQGRRGKTATHDLPKRIPHHQGCGH